MSDKELIKNNGKIRVCDTNRIILGYWKSVFYIDNYSFLWDNGKKFLFVKVKDSMLELIKIIVDVAPILFTAILVIIFFPILPFIVGAVNYWRVKKNVKTNIRGK